MENEKGEIVDLYVAFFFDYCYMRFGWDWNWVLRFDLPLPLTSDAGRLPIYHIQQRGGRRRQSHSVPPQEPQTKERETKK